MQAWKIDVKTDVMMMTVVINIVKITKNHVALSPKCMAELPSSQHPRATEVRFLIYSDVDKRIVLVIIHFELFAVLC